MREEVLNTAPVKLARNAASLVRLFADGAVPLAEKLRCVRFYLDAAGGTRLCATLPRSGRHYSMLALQVAADLARGGDGEYEFFSYGTRQNGYVEGAWLVHGEKPMQPIDWRLARDPARFAAVMRPRIYHTHMPYYRIPALLAARMDTVVLVRDLRDSLASQLVRDTQGRNDETAFVESGAIDEAIRFTNSWGSRTKRSPDRVTVVRYEDLMADPAGQLARMAARWHLDLPEECLHEAVRRTSRDEMRKRMPVEAHDANSRVGLKSGGNGCSPAMRALIEERLRTSLRFTFGYDYGYAPSAAGKET